MDNRVFELAKKLIAEHRLELKEYELLIADRNAEVTELLREAAVSLRKRVYGNKVYVRGLVEISNYCKNDCCYCGIRRSNSACKRYRLNPNEIFDTCKSGYEAGFRTFVLQGGEDGFFTDEILCELIKRIKGEFPDCAVTLSLGERSKESYAALREAGADRYLLRHETADAEHYRFLHPKELSLEKRLSCLRDLRSLGYQTGCGFMVGSPKQTYETLAKDLKLIEEFDPDMCGIGPFIPQKDTPFGGEAQGSAELTCFLLSVIRIISPRVLLPATTALGSIEKDGRERGILSGANVVMPNISPAVARENYKIYDNKLSDGAESLQGLTELKNKTAEIGYELSLEIGNARKENENGKI